MDTTTMTGPGETNKNEFGKLHNLQTGAELRAASREEMDASLDAQNYDGWIGAIDVDGVVCYVAD